MSGDEHLPAVTAAHLWRLGRPPRRYGRHAGQQREPLNEVAARTHHQRCAGTLPVPSAGHKHEVRLPGELAGEKAGRLGGARRRIVEPLAFELAEHLDAQERENDEGDSRAEEHGAGMTGDEAGVAPEHQISLTAADCRAASSPRASVAHASSASARRTAWRAVSRGKNESGRSARRSTSSWK